MIELVDKKKQLPSVDTTEANSVIMSQYLAFGSPVWVAFQISFSCYPEDLDAGHSMMRLVAVAAMVRFVLANMLLWISWKRGPPFWMKVAPTVMYLLTLTNFILIPAAGSVWFALQWTAIRSSIYGIYIGCVALIWLLQVGFYFTIIKPYIYFNAMAYIAARKQELERKERGELGENLNATSDFLANRGESFG